MKKFIAVLMSLALALCMAVSLAACGEDEIAVESVTLSSTSLSLAEGEEATLTATVAPDNATDKTVTWSSSAEAVATVAEGKVTAVAAGSAVITATAGEKSASCTVTVASSTVNASSEVTQEEWTAAIKATAEAENVTVGYEYTFSYNGTQYSTVEKLELDGENNIAYMESTRNGGDTYCGYLYIDGDTAYKYLVKENGWLYDTDDVSSHDWLEYYSMTMENYLSSDYSKYLSAYEKYLSAYEDFSYDETTSAYIMQDDNGGAYTLKFSNGYLIYSCYKWSTGNMVYDWSGFNSTSVSLPSAAESAKKVATGWTVSISDAEYDDDWEGYILTVDSKYEIILSPTPDGSYYESLDIDEVEINIWSGSGDEVSADSYVTVERSDSGTYVISAIGVTLDEYNSITVQINVQGSLDNGFGNYPQWWNWVRASQVAVFSVIIVSPDYSD